MTSKITKEFLNSLGYKGNGKEYLIQSILLDIEDRLKCQTYHTGFYYKHPLFAELEKVLIESNITWGS